MDIKKDMSLLTGADVKVPEIDKAIQKYREDYKKSTETNRLCRFFYENY